MQIITPQPSLVDQVYEAILSEIMDGKFGPDARLVQEELAEAFGVSRQLVQQALLLLRSQGILTQAPGRGLMVSALDAQRVRDLYEVRSVLDGLASAKAAERGSALARAEGAYAIMQALIARGVIGDFRAGDGGRHPDILRFGLTPLYTGFADVWQAVEHLRQVLVSGEWQRPEFNQQQAVT